ncbi:MAG: acetyltransferase-like isoleucine patch superfamily enzyme [Psychroserpens sp.]|jgi:acetyltransferase-like isoleucine patch superfamily enzyme
MAFSTPILFLVFNRPDTTIQVFECIKAQRPKYLYIAADGPRENKQEEKKLTEEVRKIATNVDWDCEVKTLFRNTNLGCGRACSEAITWFFENVEMGIILEDDCLASNSFFSFCEIMLIKYKNDEQIISINGNNYGYSNDQNSYSFSKFMNVWGWASWRRAASQIDYDMTKWRMIKNKRAFLKEKLGINFFNNQDLWVDNWLNYFNQSAEKELDGWDFQWIFDQFYKNKLSIISNLNLITNIGFSGYATHTTFLGHPASCIKRFELKFPLIVPKRKKNNKVYEDFFVKKICYLIPDKISYSFKIKNFIKKIAQKVIVKVIPEIKILLNNKEGLTNILNFNQHNKINPKVRIDEPSRIYNSSIGENTYISVNSRISETYIGKFCSIGPNLLCGWGIHPTNGISTSPMFYSNLNQAGYSYVKESKIEEREVITIGNDVFIGMNVTILDGVKIGNGAIIGAGSVVTKDVPDYAIVGGVPAKLIKYRFDEYTVSQLLKLKWWDWHESRLPLIEEYFFNVDKFVEDYKR